MKTEEITKHIETLRELLRAYKSLEKSRSAMIDLPTRSGRRGGTHTTRQANCERDAEHVHRMEAKAEMEAMTLWRLRSPLEGLEGSDDIVGGSTRKSW